MVFLGSNEELFVNHKARAILDLCAEGFTVKAPHRVSDSQYGHRLPAGIDIRKVLETGISPVIHGGMFNKEGGLIGAGMARIPMECFEKAMAAFVKKYGA